jgi:hypothetical protein
MPAGIGIGLAAGQQMVIEMHYLNASPQPLTAHVTLEGETYRADEEFTPASAFITYAQSIEIAPHGVGSFDGSCAVPEGAKFFTMSTHAHRRATLTRVTDDGEMLFESDDWESPGGRTWDAEPFYEFGRSLDYHCEYQNDLGQTVRTGPSADTDEMCMAVGYFFPATEPVFCVDSYVIP